MSDATISLLVLVSVVVLFVWNRWPVEVVAIASALVLTATGVIGLDDALSGFGDATVVLIAALFVVSEGLDSTGVTTWVGQAVTRSAGGSRRRLLLFIMLLSAAVTALINPNGSVAALLPMVVVVALRNRIRPSRLLMPLAFAASAGSLLLLTGSPVNVVISDAAKDAGVGGFGFAEFAAVGLPAVAGVLLVALLFGDRLLPERTSEVRMRDVSDHAQTLARQYDLDGVVHLVVGGTSPLIGRQRLGGHPGTYPDLAIVTVLGVDGRVPVSQGAYEEGDRLTVLGPRDSAAEFADEYGLRVEAVRSRDEVAASLIHGGGGAAEVLIPPRSGYLGEVVRPGHVVAGGLVVLAVQRAGKDRGPQETSLQTGDLVLVEGPWAQLDAAVDDDDVIVVDAPDLVRRQAVPLGPRSKTAIGVLAAMVAMLATGVVPAVVAALLAAGAMVVLRVLTVEQAYRRISWTTVLLIAGMIPLSTAIGASGAGEQIAEVIVTAVGDAGPLALLAGLFVVTVVFSQLISNTATALVMIPIAVSAASQLEVSARPVLMSLCVACAASFLTPVATPANMMVMGPAGYRFTDYWKFGLPMIAVFFAIAVGIVPLVWQF